MIKKTTRQLILEEYKEGDNIKEFAKKHGVSRQRVFQILGKRTPRDIKCLYCDTKIVTTRFKQKFCSRKCLDEYFNLKRSAFMNNPLVPKVCPQCNDTFLSYHKRSIYCSKDCSIKAREIKHREYARTSYQRSKAHGR